MQKAKGTNVAIREETVIRFPYKRILLLLILKILFIKATAQNITLIKEKQVYLDLDKNPNINLHIAKYEGNEIIIFNIFIGNDSLHKYAQEQESGFRFPDASMLITIYLLPKRETQKPILTLNEKKSSIFLSQQVLERECYKRINTYLKISGNFDIRTSEFTYTFKVNGKCYQTLGKCLTECFLMREFTTLYPNENDFVTINTNSKVFSKDDFKNIQKEMTFYPDGERVIFNNLFGRIFIANHQTQPFCLWVSPQKFHRDFGVERTNGIVLDAEWYEEGDYEFLYQKDIGIVGREFKRFFKTATFFKSIKQDKNETVRHLNDLLLK